MRNSFSPLSGSISVGVVILLAFSVLGAPRARGDEVTPRVVAEKLQERKLRVHSLRCTYRTTRTVCAGAYSLGAHMKFRDAASAPVPEHEISLTAEKTTLIDFAGKRKADQGFEFHVDVALDPAGKPACYLFKEWARSTLDGQTICMLTPREMRDPRSIPEGIEYPVEYLRSTVDDPGQSILFEPQSYPFFFLAGFIASESIRPTGADYRPEMDFRGWKFAPTAIAGGRKVVRTQSQPSPGGAHVEADLCEDFGYLPVRWTYFEGGTPRMALDLDFAVANSQPQLRSWRLQEFNREGTLRIQEEVEILSLEENPTLGDTDFVLEPEKGMVVEEEHGMDRKYLVAGRLGWEATDNFALNEMIDRSRRPWGYILAGVASAVAVVVSGFVVWRRTLFPK